MQTLDLDQFQTYQANTDQALFFNIDQANQDLEKHFHQLQEQLKAHQQGLTCIYFLIKIKNHGYDGLLKCLAKEFPEIHYYLYDLSALDHLDIQNHQILKLTQTLNDQWSNLPKSALKFPAKFKEIKMTLVNEHQILIQGKTIKEKALKAYHYTEDTGREKRLSDLKQLLHKRKPVLLITGGAKGITYRCVYELLLALTHEKHKNPNFQHPLLEMELYLIGQTKIKQQHPAENEKDALFNEMMFKNPSEYEHLSILELKQKLKSSSCFNHPKEVDLFAKEVLAQFELKHNLVKINKIYPHIHYYPMNIRSKTDLQNLYQTLDDQNKAIFGLIHGAGLIEDKKLIDKTWDSFERVVQTKLDLLQNIEDLNTQYPQIWLKTFKESFVVYFSSVSAAVGNLGQGDYAYANAYLDRYSSQHLSIQWGPWFGTGMVSPTLAKYYQKLGIKMVHIDEGTHAFIEEVLNYEAHQDMQHHPITSLRSYSFDRNE